MLKRKALLVAVLCSVFSLCPLLYSQANGSLSGTVADKTGSVVAGATVTITSQETGLNREAKTDGSGHYLVPLLPVAHYTIRIESQGFQTTEQKDIRLQVDEQREVDFALNPASVSQTVEVTATEVAVETTNPTLGQVITSEEVADLPLNGRNFVQLATLTPGTTQETNPNSFFNGAASSEVSARGSFSLSVGGSRAQSTDWLIDNNDNDELTSGGISILPTIDSIQEFKVLTYNYSAEYGTRAGPTVLVTTKSGANKFHGALYEYLRNTKLDASSYFAKTFNNSGNLVPVKEKFNLNQFGASLGGPIQKDKTFFFVNYEAKRQRHGIPFVGTVPTDAEKGLVNPAYADFTNDPFLPQPSGLLTNPYSGGPYQCDGSGNPTAVNAGGSQVGGTPCNKIPITGGPTGSGLVDPIGLQLINLYPHGLSTYTNGNNYANVPVRRLNEGNATIRVDHNFSSKDSLFARFSYDQANSFVPGGSPTWAEQSAFGSNQLISNHARNVVLSETHIVNSNNINQAYVGFNRIFNHITSFGEFGTPICMADTLGIVAADLNSKCPGAPPGLTQTPKDCLSCGLSSFLMTTYWSLGDRGFAPFQGGTNVYTFSDTFDMIRGKHDIRVGAGIRINQMNVMTNGFQDGLYIMGSGFTGDNVADLLIGQPFGSLHDQTFFGATTGRRWKMFRPFVQDDWRVTRDLTLNIGVAWALVTPESEARNRQANFDFPSQKFLIAGNPTFGSGCTNCVRSDSAAGVQFDKTAIEPRIGIAWKPFGSQNTAVRAGYAIYHDSAWSLGAQGLWQNPPYYAELDQFLFSTCPFGNSGSATPAACGIKYGFVQPNLQPITSAPNPDSFTGGLWSQNRNFKQGMVQQFNLNIERQLPGDIVLTTGYAGSRSTHILFFGLNENLDSPAACNGGSNGYFLGCGPGGAHFSAPYLSQFVNVQNISDGGKARYDSLQIKAETKNARHGLYALLGYTWARTFDSGLADGDGSFAGAMYWPLPGTKRLDWGLSQINVNDQFTASVLYDLPFGKGKRYGGDWGAVPNGIAGGWHVNVIERATSGFPLFITDSSNNSGVNFQWNGASLNRPDQICNPKLSHPTKAEWFNTSCFVHAQPGRLGNASRTPLYGPRFVNTDFSLFKSFPVHEGYALEFRGEFFNLFNHPQFGLLGSSATFMQDLSSPSNFGVINQTVHDPRVIQFALRLDF
jgi:carboxypeptidase family protein